MDLTVSDKIQSNIGGSLLFTDGVPSDSWLGGGFYLGYMVAAPVFGVSQTLPHIRVLAALLIRYHNSGCLDVTLQDESSVSLVSFGASWS